jgi:outer membrane protein OmpU
MKKLLLTTAACGLVLSAAPASAEGIELDFGGYFKGYGAFVDQDETAGSPVNDFDMIRETEIHFGGETTLDNGLTVGAHFELEADSGDALDVEESYVYFSGSWGRVNVGAEDGAGYLLQVAAPSADSNIDGIRQYVQPVNYGTLGVTGATGGIDYDMDITGKDDKITYLSPIMSGFQVGVTFSPDSDDASEVGGVGLDDQADTAGMAYEAAVRYEGELSGVGVVAGAGYALVENENETAATADDRTAWNVGVDLNMGPFGLGAIYTEDNGGAFATNDSTEEETFVVGVDYTTGAFKLGASYLTQDNTLAVQDLETDRYSAGVTYTYGPGMTFRGSLGYVEHEAAGNVDADATYVTLGTQINF